MANTKVSIPEFTSTSLDDISAAANTLRATFRSNKTKDVQYRLVQLRKLYWGIIDNAELIAAALMKDLHKSKFEAILSEIDFVTSDCIFAINNLERWAKDETWKDVPIQFSLMKFRIRKEPLGMGLIIGAYNFPFTLTVQPFIGAIAAGCTCVLKPSENSPATAMVIKKIIEGYLDQGAYAVVNGGIPETTALLDHKWDKICYTGSQTVGKIIAKKAAETLTPVLLELGGLNPAIVTKNADVDLAAKRLLWGKCLNAGQVCLSQNYMLVDQTILDDYIAAINRVYKSFFPNGAKTSPDLSRVINKRQFLRMKKMLDESKGKIVMGGEMDESELYISPTVVLVDSVEDSMMKEESFGPIMALMPFDSIDDAINIANAIDPTPLALMTFGNDKENNKILNEITSGGANLNESFMSGSIATVPFGGVGQSGTGCYRGITSFEAFTHRRTVVSTPSWLERLLRIRYMPYDMSELSRMQRLAGPRPNFDRNGKKLTGLSYYVGAVFGLGAKGAKGAFVRWLLLLVSAYALLQRRGSLRASS